MAVNCSPSPCSMLGAAGVTAIAARVAEVTVRVTEAELADAKVALIFAAPIATLEARP